MRFPRYRRQYLSGDSLIVVADELLLIDSVGVKIRGRIDFFSVVVVNDDGCWYVVDDENDDIPIEPIDTPVLVVTSSN
jgi:hypothetical protein